MPRTTTLAATLLVAAGSLQMAGDVLGLPVTKALGAVTHLSPAPKVFTAHEGFETHSNRIRLHWQDICGAHARELDAATYAGLRGPYNRRNAYGAAIAYAPVLAAAPHTAEMVAAVHSHALCSERPVLAELGLQDAVAAGAVTIELLPRDAASRAAAHTLRFPVTCPETTP